MADDYKTLGSPSRKKHGVVLMHNILPPYRVPFFNALNEELQGELSVCIARPTHTGRRHWDVPWDDVRFRVVKLPSFHFDKSRKGQYYDISLGVRRELLSRQPATVVLAGWNLPANWSALAWGKMYGFRTVAWIESWAASGRYRDPISNFLRSRFLSAVDSVVVPGLLSAQYVKDLSGRLPASFVPNPVGNQSLRGLPGVSEASSQRTLLYLGELSDRKGFDLILQATPDLLNQGFELVVAGRGPLEQACVELSSQDDRFTYVGFVQADAAGDLFRNAGVVLLPSRRDPWPLVSAEAVVAGRPIVLGPGVGSGPDLKELGDFVYCMDAATVPELVKGVSAVAGKRVPSDVRDTLLPGTVAKEFAKILRPPKLARRLQC